MATGVRDSRAPAGLSPAVVRSHRDRHGDDARDQWPTGAGTSGTQALPWPYQALAADELSRVAVGAGDTDWAPLLAGHGLRLARAEASVAEIVASIASGLVVARERWEKASG